MIWKELNITTLAELEKAARDGKLRDLPGMGAKSEEAILAGIESLSRRSGRIPLGRAWPLAQNIAAELKKVKGVVAAEPAGSLQTHAFHCRRPGYPGGRKGIGARDGGVRQTAADRSRAGQGRDQNQHRVHRRRARPGVGASARENLAPRCSTPPARRITTCKLRQMALAKGLSLSEHAFAKVKGGGEILCATEEEVYQTLGLPWIPPETARGSRRGPGCQGGQAAEVDRGEGHQGRPADPFHVERWQTVHAGDGARRGRGAA